MPPTVPGRRGPHRNPTERAEGKRRAVSLAIAGVPQRVIAAELGISQAMVSTDLSAVRRKWTEEMTADLDAARRAELSRLDSLELLALSSFAESKLGIDGGQPKFLDAAIRCSLQRSRLLGLEAGARVNAVYATNITQINASGNPDELHERAARFAAQFGLTVLEYAGKVAAGESDHPTTIPAAIDGD